MVYCTCRSSFIARVHHCILEGVAENTMAMDERLQQQTQDSAELEIDLVELLYRLLEKARYLIIAALLGALIAGVYTYRFVTPTYQSTSKLYILNTKDSVVNLSDLQIGSNLASDYVEVFSNWHVHEMVIERLNLPYSYSEIQRMISVQNKNATRILYITATSPNPEEAKQMAQTYAEVAREFIAAKMGTDMPTVFEESRMPIKPSSPNKVRNIAIGFILGFVLAAAIVVIQFIVDDRVRSADAIEKRLGLSVLGMMPAAEGNDDEEIDDGKRQVKGRRSRK